MLERITDIFTNDNGLPREVVLEAERDSLSARLAVAHSEAAKATERLNQQEDLQTLVTDIIRRDKAAVNQFDVEPETSDLVVAAVTWIAANVLRTEPVVKNQRDETVETERTAAFMRLLENPHPKYGFRAMMRMMMIDYNIQGTGYIRKLRRRRNTPPQFLQWLPYWCVTPQTTGNNQLQGYMVSLGGRQQFVLDEDMIVLKNGLSATSSWLGVSPLDTLLMEVFTDKQAARSTAAMLKNALVAGLMAIPDEQDGGLALDEETQAVIRNEIVNQFGGDKLGSLGGLGVASSGITLTHVYPDLNKLALGLLRQFPEERVASMYHVQPAVLGWASGIETVKVGATMDAMLRASWKTGVMPVIQDIEETIKRELLTEFVARDYKFVLDTRRIAELAPDVSKASDLIALRDAGIISDEEARDIALAI